MYVEDELFIFWISLYYVSFYIVIFVFIKGF